METGNSQLSDPNVERCGEKHLADYQSSKESLSIPAKTLIGAFSFWKSNCACTHLNYFYGKGYPGRSV